MFPPFPQEKAAKVLENVLDSLKNGKIVLEQVARTSEERKDQGVMLGALVCKDKNGNEVNLVTNSGNAKKLKTENGKWKTTYSRPEDETCTLSNNPSFQFSIFNFQFVEPIVSAEAIEAALSENDGRIHELTSKRKNEQLGVRSEELGNTLQDVRDYENYELQIMNYELKRLCADSLEKVHALYRFHCIDGKVRTLKEICAEYNHGKLPPAGTGDCCAPKLLDYAFSHELRPISLAEMKYNSQFSIFNFQFSVPCDERCGILLPAMLGLRILWRDDDICVVNKQSGVLSVPGRGEDKRDSIETRFLRLFGDKVEISQPAVHRLDMETSGVMILAFTRVAHRELNRQFEAKEVEKEYVALLDGVLPKKGIAEHGEMELFFRLDVENRPHQMWDSENGKKAVTEWQILDVERYRAPNGLVRNATRVLFMPHTGRTHQLRLASADLHGFGVPIIGDTLYGKCDEGERLMLHAQKVSFTHPRTGERMTIECKAEF